MVSRVLIDGRSSSNIIFWDAFQKMGISEDLIYPVTTLIHAFNGAKVALVGTIALPLYDADPVLMVTFFGIDTPLAMHVIMGR